MPTQQIHVRDHNRRKPLQDDRIHVDDYNRTQDINPRPPPGAAELGPATYGEPTPMGAVAIHESEIDLVNKIREIEKDATVHGAMTEDQLYRHERLNDQLIAARLERWHPKEPCCMICGKAATIMHNGNDYCEDCYTRVSGPKDPPRDIDKEVEEIEAIERELHGDEAELEETVDKIIEVAEQHHGTPKVAEVEKPKRAVINDMIFHPDGQVYVSFSDTDIQTDYFNSYTLRQKNAIDWIKKDGGDTIHASITNSGYNEAVRAKRFFDRVEKETGKKVDRSGIRVLMDERYNDPVEAAKNWERDREKLTKIGMKAALYHEDSWSGPGHWIIGSDNITYRGWRECTWALGPSALEGSGAH
jgi:hypothetical protein